jgi:glyoxylase-like metal-dependent hydrolase (beta-lactamase superfamily II)
MLDAYDYLLEDESVIEVGRLRLHTICTPGHTPGSICFRLEDAPIVFVGDTLFPGGVGAAHFEGGDFETLIGSVDRRLFAALPAEEQEAARNRHERAVYFRVLRTRKPPGWADWEPEQDGKPGT